MDQYYINPKFFRRKHMIIKVNNEHINLKGENLKRKLKETKKYPATEIEVRAATQDDLKFLYEKGVEKLRQNFQGTILKRTEKPVNATVPSTNKP